LKKRDAKTVNNNIHSDGEEMGVQDLTDLTLNQLETLFDRELGDSDRLQAEADCLSRRSVESLFRAGRVLSALRAILKPRRKWTQWQKEHKVSVTSAWQAIELFLLAGSEAGIAGLTRTEALKKFNIDKSTPAHLAKNLNTKKCDKKVAPKNHLTVFAGDSRDEELPTTDDILVDQPQDSGESKIPAAQPENLDDAPGAQSEVPAPTVPPTMALEYLHRINIKLEELERGLTGVTPDAHLLSLINQAIATLRRLRGGAATGIDAA
jgi:hypothetical protein